MPAGPDSSRRRQRAKQWLLGLGAALASALLAFVLGFRLEVLVEDYMLVHLTPASAPPDNIALVAIDEDTLARLPYRSPIDRKFLADLVTKLSAAGPRAIGLDILIDQPSEAAKDAALLQALRGAKAPIVIGYATQRDGLTEKQAAYQRQALKGLGKGLVTLTRDDFDGTVRSLYPGRKVGGEWMPGFAAALARLAGREPPYPQGRIRFLHDASGKLLAFKTYPAHAVGLLPADWFRGRIIIVGSALPTSDRHPTPFVTTHGADDGTPYGMAIHAHMLTQFLSGERIAAPAPWQSALIVLALAGLAALLVSARLAPLVSIAATAALLMLYLALAYGLFTTQLILLPVAAPVLAALLAAVLLSMARWYRDRAERQFIEKAFAQYVSPAVVKRISEGRHALSLGGEARMVTYVFTDLEGFTSLSENMEPAQIAELLNSYLDAVCGLYVEAEATIDKIVGDAVIGFFGAPEQQDQQARQAVELALAIDRFSEEHRKKLAKHGTPFGITRIGVHKGKAIIGNFGGSRFFDYTGIGDTVNTAARLEAANKYLGTRICVSAAVAEGCAGHPFRPIGDIVLKGKQTPIACFEPLHAGDARLGHLAGYSAAYAQMQDNAPAAAAAFEALANQFPEDGLVRLHSERLQSGAQGTIITLTGK